MYGTSGDLLTGSDAWSREARRLRQLAQDAGRALDENELILLDVHDLQRAAWRLKQAHNRQNALLPAVLWRGLAAVLAVTRRAVRTSRTGA